MIHKNNLLGRGSILLATLIWGCSFVLMDFTLNSVSTLYILAIRFSGAAVILFVAGMHELKKLSWHYVGSGALMGIILLLAYAFQTYGLERTTPGINAFLTAIYCIIVPFLNWLVNQKRPDRYNISAAFICLLGVGLISLSGNQAIGLGEGLTLICGFFYAAYIVITNKSIEGRSVVLLTMLQFAAAGITAGILALIFDPVPTNVPENTVWMLVFMTVVSTALCLFLQVFGQKRTPPSQTAIIMTFEAVFGAASSVIFCNEIITPKLAAGFIAIFTAVVISETKLDFLRRKNKNEELIR